MQLHVKMIMLNRHPLPEIVASYTLTQFIRIAALFRFFLAKCYYFMRLLSTEFEYFTDAHVLRRFKHAQNFAGRR